MSVSDPSGRGFFGAGAWGRRIYWENVPSQHRQLDEEDHGGVLESLLSTWGDEGEDLILRVRELPDQRDPYLVRDTDDGEWFYVTETIADTDADDGAVVRLIGEAVLADMPNTDADDPPDSDEDRLAEWFPWWPYAPISEIGWSWRMRWGGAEYLVVKVRSRNYDQPAIYDASISLANEVWVKGGDLAPVFDRLNNITLDPAAGVTVAAQEIGIGDGTRTPSTALPYDVPVRLRYNVSNDPAWVGPPAGAWLTDDSRVRVIAFITDGITPAWTWLYDVPDSTTVEQGHLYPEDSMVPGEIDTTTAYGTINYLSGEIQIDLSATIYTTVALEEIYALWYVRGFFMEFWPQPMLGYLAADYGFKDDQNDPIDSRRAAVANVTKYFGKKATADSYRIRGEISLFDVTATGLWRVCEAEIVSAIPASHTWEYEEDFLYPTPHTDTVHFTDLAPRYVRFDDIRGDVEFWDPDTAALVSLVDNAHMYEDASADGYSIGLAFALDVAQGYYHPLRAPATVVSSTALTDVEAAAYGFLAGYRVVVGMTQLQYDEFNFRRGCFGLSEYDKAGAVPPALGDDVFWIDVDEGWDAGALEWTVVVATAVGAAGPTVGSDVAVRYWPEMLLGECCYCRSHKMRVTVEATSEAYDHYDTAEAVDAAVERLKIKLGALIPEHVRVVEWSVAKLVTKTLTGVYGGVTGVHRWSDGEFSEASIDPATESVLMTIEQRGDLDNVAKTHDVVVKDSLGATVASYLGQWTGASDPTTWYPIATDVNMSAALGGEDPVTVEATAAAGVTFGDVRVTFRVVRSDT